jgi:hypothetical protein
MSRSSAVPVAASLLVATAGVAAIVLLFEWRFSSGDVYPRYSSLRSDPVGVKALYESLEGLPGLTVARSFVPFERWRGTGATVFYFGVPLWELSPDKAELAKQLERAAERGNYVVVSLAPFRRDPEDKTPLAVKSWGLPLEQAPSEDGDGPLWFPQAKNWAVVHSDRGKPVVVERQFGKGALALAASTYPFLNQALGENRQTALLIRLIGPRGKVVFEESHLGVVESGSVAALIRRHGLGGLAIGFLMLAVLVIWKGSAAFPPAWEPETASNGAVAGRDSLSGFASLLRRNVAPRKLMELGWSEWKRMRGRGLTPEDAAAVESIVSAEADPLRAYARSRSYLSERKRI